jgi:steroid 5-alpha reductase family enzyme
MTWWGLLLLGWALAAGIQLVLWLVQLRTGKALIVDVGWAATLVVLPLLYATLADGELEHRLLVAGMSTVAFGRLTLHLLHRVGGDEDPRYRELRARWQARGGDQARFFVFFQAQAVAAVVLSLPFLVASFNDHDGLELVEWVGLAVWLAGVVLEIVADRQLDRFRRDPARRRGVIETGLWRFSRHPNYFGQWLTWCGYALVGLAAPWGWVGIVSPLLMLLLILFVAGIPPLEERMLASRGEEYRSYQRRTSPFVPLPRRRARP